MTEHQEGKDTSSFDFITRHSSYICKQCLNEFSWVSMSEDSFLEICECCEMDNMYKDLKEKKTSSL